MTWPTDDLARTHTDEAIDDPSKARAEIDALISKVKLILAQVTAGATVWSSANDGAGSGLDADNVDTYSAASLLARTNHTGTQDISTTTGTVTVSRGGSGRTSSTAYAPVIGGTTSTAAHQSVPLGAAGTVLTSNGTGAVPSFEQGTIADDGIFGGPGSYFTFNKNGGALNLDWGADNYQMISTNAASTALYLTITNLPANDAAMLYLGIQQNNNGGVAIANASQISDPTSVSVVVSPGSGNKRNIVLVKAPPDWPSAADVVIISMDVPY